ncbi:MAG: AMP-binding protein, partial [Rikenellaceae bacterium]
MEYKEKFANFTQLINRAVRKYGDQDALRIRKGAGFRSISFSTLAGHTFDLAASLTHRGYTEGAKLAVLGENSYGWILSYLGTVVTGATIVPLDKELSDSEIQGLVEQSGVSAIFCSEDYMDVFEGYDLKIPMFVIGSTELHVGATPIEELVAQGASLRESDPCYGQGETTSDKVSTIVFTSGTTGFSKGVMLTRSNLLSNVQICFELAPLSGTNFTVLPFNHTYELTLGVLYSMLHQGIALALNNSVKNFAQNMKMFKPDTMLIVPLIAENMMKNVWATIEQQGKMGKVRFAMKLGRFLHSIGIDVRRRLFAPIHEAFGGQLKDIFVGGAHMNASVAKDFHDIGINVNIGYGITECSPLIGGNVMHKRGMYHSCGFAVPYTELILDNPNEEGDGEILARGPS